MKLPGSRRLGRRPLLFKCQACRGQNWHSVVTTTEPVWCFCGLFTSYGQLSVCGERQGGARREVRAGSALLCPSWWRPRCGLLCKLQWPFTAGVQQNCFLYVPEMFMHLFSLARDRLLQLSDQAQEGGFLAGALFISLGRKNCLFNETHLTF